jgi:DNA-directed RNA polymerase specialized sigma24 family protein
LRDPEAGPVQRAQNAELVAQLHAALDTLNAKQRSVVVLYQFKGMSYAEVGRVMNLSVKAIKSMLARARQNLQAVLSDYVHMDDPRPAAPAGCRRAHKKTAVYCLSGHNRPSR